MVKYNRVEEEKQKYFVASMVKPGEGYWIKMKQNGQLILTTTFGFGNR